MKFDFGWFYLNIPLILPATCHPNIYISSNLKISMPPDSRSAFRTENNWNEKWVNNILDTFPNFTLFDLFSTFFWTTGCLKLGHICAWMMNLLQLIHSNRKYFQLDKNKFVMTTTPILIRHWNTPNHRIPHFTLPYILHSWSLWKNRWILSLEFSAYF